MTIELGTPSKTRPCEVNGSSVRVTRPALFRPEIGIGNLVDSPALRDGPPLASGLAKQKIDFVKFGNKQEPEKKNLHNR